MRTEPLPGAERPPAQPAPAADAPRARSQPAPAADTPRTRATPPARPAPPPGMTDADVEALYAKYVQAKQTLGEHAGPGAYGKLLKTISLEAPRIMERYKSRGVDFSIVVKDNQVIIRAKPKP